MQVKPLQSTFFLKRERAGQPAGACIFIFRIGAAQTENTRVRVRLSKPLFFPVHLIPEFSFSRCIGVDGFKGQAVTSRTHFKLACRFTEFAEQSCHVRKDMRAVFEGVAFGNKLCRPYHSFIIGADNRPFFKMPTLSDGLAHKAQFGMNFIGQGRRDYNGLGSLGVDGDKVAFGMGDANTSVQRVRARAIKRLICF